MREVTPTFVVTLAGLVIVSIATLAFVVAPGFRAQSGTGSLPQATTVHEGNFTQPTVVHDMPDEWSEPVLTDEQKEQAVAIASNDQRVRSLLAAHQPEVTDIII